MKNTDAQKGFTLIEIMIVIGILVLLLGISFSTFYNQSRSVSVTRDADNALSYLQKARNQTLSSVNNSSYGVRFASSSVSFFEGTAYSALATKATYKLGSGVTLSTSLTGGTTELYFARLTGEPSATGTITFVPAVGTTSSKTIIIRGTGLAEIQ